MQEAHTRYEPYVLTDLIATMAERAKAREGKELMINRPDYVRVMALEDSPVRHEMLSTQLFLAPDQPSYTDPQARCVRICNPFAGSGTDILVMGYGKIGDWGPLDYRQVIWYTSPDVLEKKTELQGKAKLFSELIADVLDYLHDDKLPS